MQTIVVIPARGGSKTVPRKNLADLGGQPMIRWAIDSALAAKAAGAVDRVVITTDDIEIAKTAEHLGAELPFMRPDELATDEVSIIPVLMHAADAFDALGWNPDAILSLQPTAPFVRTASIVNAVDMMQETGCDSVTGMVRIDYGHPFRAYGLDEGGALMPFVEDGERYLQKQDLPPYFTFSGGLYLRKRSRLSTWGGVDFCLGETRRGIELDAIEGLDIDTPMDLTICRAVASDRQAAAE